MTKKKWFIIGGIVTVAIVVFIAINIFGGKGTQPETALSAEEIYGIEYFEVPDVEQVYINGVIQPNQMESFAKDNKFSGDPEIKVKNGEVVDKGTVLYVYEDKEVTKQMEDLNNQLSRNYTKTENVRAKWQKAIDNFNSLPGEQRTVSASAELDDQYQSQIDAIAEENQYLTDQVNDLSTSQFISTTAKFKGRVLIPEVKEENTPILTLTSDGFYVSGKVNEKDLPKIAVDKPAEITVISNGQTVKGKISYIDNNPIEAGAAEAATPSEGSGGSMSNYAVKLTLDSTDNIKNGYHVQATINLDDDKPNEIPAAAVKEDGDKKYVLVNDFGSVIRRDIQTGEVKGDKIVVTSGLESADRIIVSSKKELKEGDILEGSEGAEEPADEKESK
ncbi:efflux RND transporter periplasmic adaptor subunit [Vagococcus acidifermentans]|uniref:RND transporter n=1 Tax=Vagococcus acidifermentans TaxID=564710 RepID=A0A430B2K2_9ENTE|nr:HlyD family efflux transporter periplasmic adaptor subunit [Vagococcus acidifermentans]RSU14565.1 RND transporter [Vagococcus acidifermentans]